MSTVRVRAPWFIHVKTHITTFAFTWDGYVSVSSENGVPFQIHYTIRDIVIKPCFWAEKWMVNGYVSLIGAFTLSFNDICKTESHLS